MTYPKAYTSPTRKAHVIVGLQLFVKVNSIQNMKLIHRVCGSTRLCTLKSLQPGMQTVVSGENTRDESDVDSVTTAYEREICWQASEVKSTDWFKECCI